MSDFHVGLRMPLEKSFCQNGSFRTRAGFSSFAISIWTLGSSEDSEVFSALGKSLSSHDPESKGSEKRRVDHAQLNRFVGNINHEILDGPPTRVAALLKIVHILRSSRDVIVRWDCQTIAS